MSWSREQVNILIDELKKHPCLYAVKSKAYSNKHLRQKALEEIQSSLQTIKPTVSITEIKNKFSGLKATFLAERRKQQQSRHSGMDEDNVYQPNLWYFDKLMFLLDHTEPRQSFDSLPVGNNEPQDVNDETLLYDSDAVEYVIDGNGVLHPTSEDANSNSESSSGPPKRKRSEATDVVKEASAALKCLSKTMEQRNALVAINNNDTSNDRALANFIVSKLNQITNPDVRIDVEENITQCLYDGIKKCRNYSVCYY